MVTVTDAHIHIQPFEMMPPAVAATFWKGKENRAELEGYAADPRRLLARMDEDQVARVGLTPSRVPSVRSLQYGTHRRPTRRPPPPAPPQAGPTDLA